MYSKYSTYTTHRPIDLFDNAVVITFRGNDDDIADMVRVPDCFKFDDVSTPQFVITFNPTCVLAMLQY